MKLASISSGLTAALRLLLKRKGHGLVLLSFLGLLASTTPAQAATYSLSGLTNLYYEGHWGSPQRPFKRVETNVTLALSGQVVDRRLMVFTVSGIFGKVYTTGIKSSTIEGVGFSTTLLSEKPRKSLLVYLPQPINITYTYNPGTGGAAGTSTSNFRLNFIYNLGYVEIGKAPEVLDAGNTGNTNDTNNTDNVENDEEVKKVRKPKRRIFHIPFIYFDFSRDTYDGFGGSSTNDRLNVRAEQTEGHYYYSAEYRMGDTSVSPAIHYLNLRATYDELYADRITRFSNYASGNLIKSAGSTTIAIYDQFAWSRQMGKGINDFVLLSGGGQYFNTNDKNNYVLNLGVTRNSIYSERLAYSFNVVGTYDPGQERSPASGTASGSLFYRPLDYVVISGQSSAGVSSDINSYSYSLGAQADRYFKGLMVNPGFLTSYAVSGKDTERGSKIYLNLATSLGSRFSLSAQNTYFMRDLVRDAVSSSSKELSLQVSLSAKLSRYLVTAYVAYGNLVSSLKTSSMIAGTSVETNWSGRVFLNMRGYAQKSDNNPVFMFLTTNLGFNWRQVAASLEYSHSRYSSTTDNRLYVRMTRSFYTVVRPFF